MTIDRMCGFERENARNGSSRRSALFFFLSLSPPSGRSRPSSTGCGGEGPCGAAIALIRNRVPNSSAIVARPRKRRRTMFLNLRHVGQIALPVSDVDRSEAFYADVLGLPKLYRFGDLTFFDCAGVRLLLEKARGEIAPAGLHLFPLRRHRARRRGADAARCHLH